MVEKIATPSRMAWLIEDLLRVKREYVSVVITPDQGGRFPFSADAVEQAAGEHTKVFRIEDPKLTFALTDALDKEFSVFGGAARVYPTGTAWRSDLYATPLVYPSEDANARQQRLIRTTLGVVHSIFPPEPGAQTVKDLRVDNDLLRSQMRLLQRKLATETARRVDQVTEKASDDHEDVILYQPSLFPDKSHAMTWAIYSMWVLEVPPNQKPDFPMHPAWGITPWFADTFEELTKGQQKKALRTVMQVLCGMGVNKLQIHPLLEGDGGKPVIASDGSVCMRAYVEENTPSARRLHYWKTPQNMVIFSRVAKHDDFRP